MVYVRKAYDKVVNESISTRSRDPSTSIDMQRNMDEAFRAINGLRIIAGADPPAIAAGLAYNRALSQVSARFNLSAGDQPPPGTDPDAGVSKIPEDDKARDYNLWKHGPAYSNYRYHWTEAIGSIYVWSITKVTFKISTQPSGGSYTANYRLYMLEPGKLPTAYNSGDPVIDWVNGRTIAEGGLYKIAASQIYGQETGKRRTFKENETVYLAVDFGATTLEDLTLDATFSILYDQKGGV